jgi:hypothetical protein
MTVNDSSPSVPEPPGSGEVKGPSIRLILARAKMLYFRMRAARLWLEYPSAAVGRSDREEVLVELRKLDELATALGKVLVGEPDLAISQEQRDHLCSSVGHALIAGFHEGLIREFAHELRLWQEGDWDALHRAGKLSDEDYRALIEE